VDHRLLRNANQNSRFTLPLLTPQARTGWKVGLNLSYNSQNWRQDTATWNLGKDVGYGYGWKLQAGSLAAQTVGGTVAQYLFTDSTGAEYRLSVNTGGVWTSLESIYVSYDSGAGRLYLNDGSFWVMGCTSAASEQDAGTIYPTVMQDSNGNQVLIRYGNGNTSARIQEVEDVRAQLTGSGRYATYTFTYDGTNHLASITNNVQSPEGYTFTMAGAGLVSPFDQTSYGNTSLLSGVSVTGLGLSYTFTTGTSGELTKVVFPYGGYLSWSHSTVSYGGTTQREVTSRKYSGDETAGSERSFAITRTGGSAVHLTATLDDTTANSRKVWTFGQSGATIGLVTSFEQQQMPTHTARSTDAYTWVQDAVGN
jgi:hypothetical protein